MTLPEIPDEAVEVACLAEAEVVYGNQHFTRRDAMIPVASVRAGLAAAWPHLYAAALRSAADEFDADVPIHGESMYGKGIAYTAKTLRLAADEAERR